MFTSSMANKVTDNIKSQELMEIAVQSQLARIKKEEEEELWISGEELYTEGSSDEEEYKTQSRSRRKINSNQSSRTSSTNRSADLRGLSPISIEIKAKSDHSKGEIGKHKPVPKNISAFDRESSENLDRPTSAEPQDTERLLRVESSLTSITKDAVEFSTEEDQTENREISWKANRGTFVLPEASNDTKEKTDKC